jgi:nitroreductase
MNQVFETVRNILAVRQFETTPVSEDTLGRIVEAARLSASAMNKQPWQFIVVQDPDGLRRLGALARSGPYIAQAPVAVVVAVEGSKFAVSDASRAIQSMMLTAWAEGVGSNWVGFGGLDEVKELLGIPTELDVLAVVPFGYPAKAVSDPHKKRKSLGEVVHQERYGVPFRG